MKGQKVLFSSKSDEYETPDDLFEEYNRVYKFNLDAAASKKNAKCKAFFTQKEDGLVQSWKGKRVWINPPYSNWQAWVHKACYEVRNNGCEIAVMLLPSRTDTKAFHEYLWDRVKGKPRNGVELYFIKGRIVFKRQDHGAPFPSLIAVIGTI